MKKKNYLKVLSLFSFLIILSGFAYNNSPLVNINKISVLPGSLNTRIYLETSSPLPPPHTFYAADSPSTIVVDLNKIDTNQHPQIIQDKSSLVKTIKIQNIAENRLRLFIDLKEQVPYRIFSNKNATTIELNQIQRNPAIYTLEKETIKALEKKTSQPVFLKKININQNNKNLMIKALLDKETVAQVFALGNPLRLVVDLLDTVYTGSPAVYPVNKLGIEKVRTAQFKTAPPYPITRIVFDLKQPQFYSLLKEKSGMTIAFYQNSPAPLLSSPPFLTKKTEQEVSFPPPEIQAKKSPKKSKPLLKPVESAPKEKVSAPNLVQPDSPAEYKKSQEEQFKPKTIAEPEEKYKGEIISLKFKDADLRDVVLYLGELAGLNVVFDPEVRGTVTVDLKDVPWDQALDIILKINKMGKTLEGNILRIAPISILTREQEEQRKLKKTKEMAGPILVKTFTLSYSKAKDVQSLLQSKISERGEIIVDERTNTLIISDVKDRIDLLEKLISVFDTPTPQVSIEARIVEATSNFVRNLGIQWGFKGIADPFYGNQTSLQFPHKVLADGALIPAGIVTKGIGGPLGGYAVNLPAPAFSSALGLSFANVLDTFRLDMAISALETTGQGRIISTPSVTTQNNQEAEILQGRQIPVQTVANFTVTTRYVNAALELKATPQITAEGTIIMYIEIRNNAADFANLVNGIPPIITQSAKTTVMVPDGGTTVIGGIYRTEDSITRERVPFLHKIPILGSLFRSFARTKQNRELLIFITPRIIKK